MIKEPSGWPARRVLRSTGEPPDPTLALRVSEMARDLHDELTAEDVLKAVVAAAVVNVPGADFAGVTLVPTGATLTTHPAAGDVANRLDQVQAETGQGPGLSSARERRTVRCDDLSTDERWPEFSGRAVQAGVRSMLCFQLFVGDNSLGALNMYARDAGAFTVESEDIGLLLAAHSAVALAAVMEARHLRVALSTREVIGQAKGILMERHKVDSDAAFRMLLHASQSGDRDLSAIAEMVATTGRDPTQEAIAATWAHTEGGTPSRPAT